ncbi:MAG: DUF2075 domain-containing protein [Candidatus Riflebacteria bacterium]|nr:DUF2075 domain-containing protein [Candidatus Riflebacteria bacterium]
MGKYVDAVVVTQSVIFVLEFKVGERFFPAHAIDQVWDYALDLKNFHETSHEVPVAPILIATEAGDPGEADIRWPAPDRLLAPLKANRDTLGTVMAAVLASLSRASIDPRAWEQGRYSPTPTIIEAAMALYRGHGVEEISRSDACAINLAQTSEAIGAIIKEARASGRKAICFVTGVPGAGKTLVGLNIATQHQDRNQDLYSVFLSGNGPLVAVLREALARDKVGRTKAQGRKISKKEATSEVQMFIQNVHHFRDECLVDAGRPPIEHVAIFDEAQRAWNLEQTSTFMRLKKKRPGFEQSEPEFLLSCLDRHPSWATVVCLVGGGQEINTGEAGIGEWFAALARSFPAWDIYVSPNLSGPGFSVDEALRRLPSPSRVHHRSELHLSVSLRSFRAEHVSRFVGQVLDLELAAAKETLRHLQGKYPIRLTRDVETARRWLRGQARGPGLRHQQRGALRIDTTTRAGQNEKRMLC